MSAAAVPAPPDGREGEPRSLSPWWMAAPALLILLNFVAAQTTTPAPTRNAVYDGSVLAGSIVQDAVIIVYVLLAARIGGSGLRGILALRPTGLSVARLALPLLVLMIVADLALEPLTHAGREQGIAPTHAPQSAEQWRLLVLAFVAFALVAPLAEELLFRGLGFAALGRQALLLTSLLFALAHALAALLLPVFLGGLALGWVRRRSGSLYPSLAMHIALNTTGLVLALVTA